MFRTTALTAALPKPIPHQVAPLRRFIAIAAVTLCLVSAAPAARADIITFANIPAGTFGPGVTTVEGNFTYDLLPGSGRLFGEYFGGNPAPHVEGVANANGGTLRVVRHDVSGGLFTFQGLDVAQENLGSPTIHVFGLLGGVQQGEDDFVTSALVDTWLTKNSLNLSGVAIDELRIRLDASGTTNAGFEMADNVRLTTVNAVPAPPAVVLVGLGAGCVALKRYVGRRATV
jgi:hypothetical protein